MLTHKVYIYIFVSHSLGNISGQNISQYNMYNIDIQIQLLLL